MEIKAIESGFGIGKAFPSAAVSSPAASPSEGFSKFLGEMMEKVNSTQVESDQAVQQLVTGETKSLHEVMIAMEKASISFQFMTQVRNKAVEAYQEIMRMPV
ncbi:flagellar hook-basal body complex protein FliE [Geobacter sp. OR-1]|uniref:flagellar hook-basal body complex protein FliE n=1 Tax=Geobacter sp. OR-1 TaxID=1266765 RepID=UPI000541DB31|nr:flagellar hook-basal body complex protein FliE [Geobacter sp. OR-1]GAM09700.1 flagellar hook-basal body complex protein FliE [Geobacter sp. OR-1]